MGILTHSLPRLNGLKRLKTALQCCRKNQHGSVLVELALVLPVFTMFFLGLLIFAMAFLTYCNATYAARMGARYASMHSNSSLYPTTQTDTQNYVKSMLFMPGVGASNANVSVVYGNWYKVKISASNPQTGNNVGDLLSIGIQWTQNLNIPFIPSKSLSTSVTDYRIITR